MAAGIIQRIAEAAHEIIEREREDLTNMDDPNCFGAGYAHGAISAAKEILDCLNEEEPEQR